MPDVPRRDPLLDPTNPEHQARRLRNLANGFSARGDRGGSRWPQPVGTSDRLRAGARSIGGRANAQLPEKHHIQGWPVTDDATDTFTLDFVPSSRSWNLELNGVRVHRDEFEITAKTLTILNPAGLFLGCADDAAATGQDWDLEIQYDYRLAGAPATGLAYADISFNRSNTGSATVTAPGGFVLGDVGVHVVYVISKDTPTGGTPGGWTALEGPTAVFDGARTHYTASFWKVADDADVGATFAYGATGPDAKDSTWVFVRGAATVHASGFAHRPQGGGLSMALASVSASDNAIVLRVGAGRQSTGPMHITLSAGTAVQTDAGTSGDLVTSVSWEAVPSGAVPAATSDSNGDCAHSNAVFVVQ